MTNLWMMPSGFTDLQGGQQMAWRMNRAAFRPGFRKLTSMHFGSSLTISPCN